MKKMLKVERDGKEASAFTTFVVKALMFATVVGIGTLVLGLMWVAMWLGSHIRG